MRFLRYPIVFFAVGIVLVLATLRGAAPSAAQESPTSPAALLEAGQGPAEVDAVLGTIFTYQGSLKRDGQPANTTCTLSMSLWDSLTGGTQVGSTQTLNNVQVQDGAFTVQVDFGNQFTGAARWLQSAVQCTGDGVATTLSPRQPLNAVPYALGLRPGAVMQDSTAGDSLYVEKNAVNSNAIHGKGTATGSIGVWGEGVNNTGVYGLSQGGAGVWGKSTSASGVYGESTSWAGVWGQSSGASGVVGISAGQFDGGVYGEHTGSGGYGVYGKAPNGAGVFGQSTAWVGVYGQTNAANVAAVMGRNLGGGVAGRFEGSVQITGGADLAELFDASGDSPVEPGTLLIIDEVQPGQLRASDGPYDTRVAGVASGAGGVKPGLTLHQEGVMEGEISVAIAGRVYVKAEADSAPIRPGDLLTTSGLPGHAMKAADRERAYGAVIGKALSGLEAGTGLVLVLVNLQ